MADGNLPTDEERVKEERVRENPEDNPRTKRLMEIANAEADSKKDLEDVPDEAHDKLTEVSEETVEVEAKSEPVPQKRKITVNGREQELPVDEIDRLAAKAAGADELFRQASQMRKEAEELRKAPKEEQTTVEEDDRALARALQMGSEEEATAVIRKIRARPSETADVQRLIDQRLEFRNSAEWFKGEYPELVSDPNMLSLVLSEDEKLVKSGDTRSYKERYKQIGDSLRKWRDGFKAPTSQQERIERKASLKVVPAASVRSATPKEEDDGPSDREFIAQEARRRGQDFPR